MKTSSMETAGLIIKAVEANVFLTNGNVDEKYEHPQIGIFLIAFFNRKANLPHDIHELERMFAEAAGDGDLTERLDIKIRLVRNYLRLCTPLDL